PAPYPHVLGQRNFRRHREGELERCSFGEWCVTKQKHAASAYVLCKTVQRASIQLDGKRQMHLEALATASLKPNGFCAHSHPFGNVDERPAEAITLSRFCLKRKSQSW